MKIISSRKLISWMKIEPFVYNTIFIIFSNILFLFEISEFAYYAINTFIYCAPLIIIFNLIKGRLANLCKYHRLATICPLFGYIASSVNDYVYNFEDEAMYIMIFITIFVTIITILCGYKVFIVNEERRK